MMGPFSQMSGGGCGGALVYFQHIHSRIGNGSDLAEVSSQIF